MAVQPGRRWNLRPSGTTGLSLSQAGSCLGTSALPVLFQSAPPSDIPRPALLFFLHAPKYKQQALLLAFTPFSTLLCFLHLPQETRHTPCWPPVSDTALGAQGRAWSTAVCLACEAEPRVWAAVRRDWTNNQQANKRGMVNLLVQQPGNSAERQAASWRACPRPLSVHKDRPAPRLTLRESAGCSEANSKKLLNKTGTAAQSQGQGFTSRVLSLKAGWPVSYSASKGLRSLTYDRLATQESGDT